MPILVEQIFKYQANCNFGLKKLAIFTASAPAAVNLTGNATKAVVEEVYDVIADDLPDLKNRTFKVHNLDYFLYML